MRKICVMIAIWTVMAMALSGCGSSKQQMPVTTPIKEEEKTVVEVNSPEDLEGIRQRSVPSYQKIWFETSDNARVLEMMIPGDWTIVSRGNAFMGAREGIDMAEFHRADGAYVHDENCLSHDQMLIGEITAEACVLPSENKDWCGYRHHVEIIRKTAGEPEKLIMDADYAELNAFSIRKFMANSEMKLRRSDPGLNMLRKFQSIGRESILILGNSFINSSSVGEILLQMIAEAGRTETVYPVSRGYATVQSYVESGDCLDLIASRQFGVVFMCGFYGQNAVDALGSIVDVCRESGTMLVIFPAHNESESVIKSACAKWEDDAFFLDWKGEIDGLIRYTDATRSDMCVADQHSHSTAAAGYVGAHMIYRALFGEVPPPIYQSPFVTDTAKKLFGSRYVETGWYEMVSDSAIYRFR